jgi:succinate dehydrogenase flavin-adding protein (antitoxin of CptAB toxin-antitoxin module)
LVHQHQKELNVLQEQFQSILDAKDDQINGLVYKVKQSQYEEKESIVDDNYNEVSSFIYLNYSF